MQSLRPGHFPLRWEGAMTKCLQLLCNGSSLAILPTDQLPEFHKHLRLGNLFQELGILPSCYVSPHQLLTEKVEPLEPVPSCTWFMLCPWCARMWSSSVRTLQPTFRQTLVLWYYWAPGIIQVFQTKSLLLVHFDQVTYVLHDRQCRRMSEKHVGSSVCEFVSCSVNPLVLKYSSSRIWQASMSLRGGIHERITLGQLLRSAA